ncbi:hypothetical protein AMS69_17875 [Haloarcula rubripromontorii]|uniref:Uncharacterized protein n=1 Tax=Haloarcula rubripromontorii TaxID=1705562 RepID=A0A0N0U8W4_9EURY|nr:hypothetical protein AMS69_17875 [Haloarcula rubripromontorii]
MFVNRVCDLFAVCLRYKAVVEKWFERGIKRSTIASSLNFECVPLKPRTKTTRAALQHVSPPVGEQLVEGGSMGTRPVIVETNVGTYDWREVV